MTELNYTVITEALQNKFGNAIQKVEEPFGMLTITVDRSIIVELFQYLYQDEFGFTFLTDLTGVHLPEPDDVLGVVYHLHHLPKNCRIRIKTFFPKSDPTCPSLTSVFEAANWMERETFDFYGIVFQGHPNLKRILNVDDLGYHPMRKEYALEDPTRDDKSDNFFGR
ncbi:MAG: NADH-quinone oxidoreductase subunit C [Cytophagaceae bacterium]|jgi:NADH-quinone oxidoreductase subunit C|nr:NADH-quinone oxidoreductase subunit C [Cytophagaceae bacterium]